MDTSSLLVIGWEILETGSRVKCSQMDGILLGYEDRNYDYTERSKTVSKWKQ